MYTNTLHRCRGSRSGRAVCCTVVRAATNHAYSSRCLVAVVAREWWQSECQTLQTTRAIPRTRHTTAPSPCMPDAITTVALAGLLFVHSADWRHMLGYCTAAARAAERAPDACCILAHHTFSHPRPRSPSTR